MSSVPKRPQLRHLFGDAAERRAATQYWIVDTVVGLTKLGLFHLLRRLPIDWSSNLGAFLSRFTRRSYPASEARARRLWIHLHPDKADPRSVDAAMDRLWRNVSRTMAEFAVLSRLWDAGRIHVSGAEYPRHARASGRPVLAVLLHLGNWETAPVAIAAMGERCVGFYLPPANRFEHAIAVKSRIDYGAILVPTSSQNLRTALQELRAVPGQFGIFIDEYMNGRVHAPAFGRELKPLGNISFVARLAMKTNAIVLPVYSVRDGDRARFKVTFLPPVEMVTGGDRDAALMDNIARLDTVIAPVIAKHVDQWFYALDFEFDAPAAEGLAPTSDA
jgi:KDO2-lipid IV(A) lauroyltransferase